MYDVKTENPSRTFRRTGAAFVLTLLALAGCGGKECLDHCSEDGDCGPDMICGSRNGERVCVPEGCRGCTFCSFDGPDDDGECSFQGC